MLDTVRFIPFSYNNADSQSSALRLILSLFPDWEHAEGEIEFVRFTDGITNTLLKAIKKKPGYSDEQIDNEAVLLRAYGQGTDILIDRQKEALNHTLLSELNLAPTLLARFQNGLLYRFIRGHPCSPDDLRRESVWRAVGRRLGQWHAVIPILQSPASIPTSDQDGLACRDPLEILEHPHPNPISQDAINTVTPDKPVPNVWTVMQKWIYALPDGTKKDQLRKERLQKELVRNIRELASRPGLGKDGLVVGHCDLLSGNVIILPRQHTTDTKEGEDTVNFIDYEYATPAPAAFDIANHFAEWGGFDCDYNVLPTRSQRRAFLGEYLNSYNKFLNGEKKEVPEISSEKLQQIFDEVDIFRGMPGFYWGIWALIQAQISQIDFDYASYAEVRLAEYWAWRGEPGTGKEYEAALLRERRWAQEE
ncbi:MAG: hypothetical protein M1834_005736 [Cirrosporium novae-zelandiae]|nr:MAG: hypothetical protein M1834_005736 [Cirrosporium novae-zelandiae]